MKQITLKRAQANNSKQDPKVPQQKMQQVKRDVDRDDLMNVIRSSKDDNLP